MLQNRHRYDRGAPEDGFRQRPLAPVTVQNETPMCEVRTKGVTLSDAGASCIQCLPRASLLPPTMTRFSLLSFGLVAILALSGCSDVLSQRSPNRRGDYRQAERRADRRADSRDWNRLDRDARDYAQRLDRQLRLRDRQEQQIRRILVDRGDRLRRGGRTVYPFPRSTRSSGYWRDVDARIERVLDREQSRRYREMTRGRSGKQKGKKNKRPRRRGRN